jgi:hypothetical protein
MAKKIVGVYSKNISFTENKSTDLYITIDNSNLFFSVKNAKNSQFIALEHFMNDLEETGWDQLISFAQKNSKLINIPFSNVFFVWNNSRFIITKNAIKQDAIYYQQELNLVHGINNTDEVYFNQIADDLILAYSIPDQLIVSLSKLFPNGAWHHYMEFAMKHGIDKTVSIFLFDQLFCLNIKQDGITKLANYYKLEGADQNMYQILNACNHSAVETNISSVSIWGVEEDKHTFINTLANYFKTGQLVESAECWDKEDNDNCPNNIYTTYFIY